MSDGMLDRWPVWRDEMTVELRRIEVPGAVIGDILAEVEAHIAESGESPEEAFGDPRDYARHRADGLPRSGSWSPVPKSGSGTSIWLTWGIDRVPPAELMLFTVCGVGGLLVGNAAFALDRARETTWGLDPLVTLSLGFALALAPLLLFSDDRVIDPRNGNTAQVGGLRVKGVSAAVWLTLFLLAAGLGWFSQG